MVTKAGSTKTGATKAAAAKAPKTKTAAAKGGNKPMLTVTRMRSAIGRRYDQEQCLRGLGLSRRGMTKTVEDTPSIRGMIEVVKHLVRVEPAGAGD